MRSVKGDLIQLALDGAFDVIVHGCNCFHAMGAGIAKGIATTFPEALAADRATAMGDRAKLGTVSFARLSRGTRDLAVVNAYTQFDYRGFGPLVSYEAIGSCFRAVRRTFGTARIGYPMIGAGLAGGDWTVIAPLIDTALDGCDRTLVVFDPS